MLIRHRESSDRIEILSGCDWNFAWYPSIHVLRDLFYLPDYEPGKEWKKEKVPFCWQMRGYDSPQYTNIRYPFPFDPPYVPQDNPCGAYLHHFEWHRSQEAPCAFLNFEGVDSCFYVWLNGAYVGYSQVSHHTTEFDVTDFLQEGDNLLKISRRNLGPDMECYLEVYNNLKASSVLKTGQEISNLAKPSDTSIMLK